MNTESMTFFHGTGKSAAEAIISGGSNESLFHDMGAFALGREIRHALLNHAGIPPEHDYLLHTLKGPGSEHSVLWVSALSQIDQRKDQSLFEYGHFFATLNLTNAYRYAIANPYRSEFLQAIAESLRLLEHLGGHPLPNSVADRFPHVSRAIAIRSSPVVLELTGIARERLLTEKGSEDLEDEFESFREMQEFSGVNAPAAFRIRDVTAKDIVAIHDLDGWSSDEVHDPAWHPDSEAVAAARRCLRS